MVGNTGKGPENRRIKYLPFSQASIAVAAGIRRSAEGFEAGEGRAIYMMQAGVPGPVL